MVLFYIIFNKVFYWLSLVEVWIGKVLVLGLAMVLMKGNFGVRREDEQLKILSPYKLVLICHFCF